MKIRLSDYVSGFLTQNDIKDVFTVTGGGAMFLNRSFGTSKELRCIYHHHEQACATAAEGYFRVSKKIAAVCVTTGPGGTNAITGVLGAWLDSIPMLVISGQVKYETTVASTGLPGLRQLGDQEFDIVSCVSGMTKYAIMVTQPISIRYHLEKALFLAKNGRMGPVWLDVPLNVQSAVIETDDLYPFDSQTECLSRKPVPSPNAIDVLMDKLRGSKRPLIYIGNGIHLSDSEEKLIRLVEKTRVPVVCGFGAHDILPYGHPFYIGRPGTIGDRAGNFAVQSCDFLLILGCRLNIRQTGYNFTDFAPRAFKAIADIDPLELHKPTLTVDLPISCDVSDLIDALLEQDLTGMRDHSEWQRWCLERKEKYPVCLPEYYKKDEPVNPYCFMDRLGEILPQGQVMAASNATACICSFQTLKIKIGQRIFSNSGSAQMGYGLPAAIGASVADGIKNVICFEGDGSLQMNIQELQTVIHNRLPIKLIVLNNNGYHSIRQTQKNFFGDELFGCTPVSGVSFPDTEKIAWAYGIGFARCSTLEEITPCLKKMLENDDPFILEVVLDPDVSFAPRSSSKRLEDGRIVSRPLDDLAPFLPEEERRRNMIIDQMHSNYSPDFSKR